MHRSVDSLQGVGKPWFVTAEWEKPGGGQGDWLQRREIGKRGSSIQLWCVPVLHTPPGQTLCGNKEAKNAVPSRVWLASCLVRAMLLHGINNSICITQELAQDLLNQNLNFDSIPGSSGDYSIWNALAQKRFQICSRGVYHLQNFWSVPPYLPISPLPIPHHPWSPTHLACDCISFIHSLIISFSGDVQIILSVYQISLLNYFLLKPGPETQSECLPISCLPWLAVALLGVCI